MNYVFLLYPLNKIFLLDIASDVFQLTSVNLQQARDCGDPEGGGAARGQVPADRDIESPKAAKEEMMDSVKKAVGFPCIIVKPNRGAANTNQLISTLVSRSEGKWGGAEGCSGPGLQVHVYPWTPDCDEGSIPGAIISYRGSDP